MQFALSANKHAVRFSEQVYAGIPMMQEDESRARFKSRLTADSNDSSGEIKKNGEKGRGPLPCNKKGDKTRENKGDNK